MVYNSTSGIVIIDKAGGKSSGAVVGRLKRIYNTPCGHFGTLDPMASGLLVVGVGRASRLFDYMQGGVKRYEAVFEFGYTTDTLDALGQITDRTVVLPTIEGLRAVASNMVGSISQIPPQYSAKVIGGVRAYKLARQGVEVELKPKDVTIYSLSIVEQISDTAYAVAVECSSGTYIRSIARDLAGALGSLATMTKLRRTNIGKIDIAGAKTVEEIESNPAANLISTESIIDLPSLYVQGDIAQKIINGIKLNLNDAPQGSFKIYIDGRFYGIAHTQEGYIKVAYKLV